MAKPDELRTIGKDNVVKKVTCSTSHKWARQSQSIARTIAKSEMSGLFSKNIVVSPNEIAAIVQDGKVVEVVESGKVMVGGLFKKDSYSKDVEVIMMDTSPKDSNWQVSELWTNDQHEVAAKGLLRYRVADPKKFYSMIYAYSSFDEKGERFLSLEDINRRLKSEVLTRVLQPETNSMEIGGIYGNRDFQKKVEEELELQLKSTLDMWGLELLKFTTEWDMEDYTGLVRVRRGFEKEEELKELDTLSKEGDHERVGRVGVADVHFQHAVKGEVLDFGRHQKIRDVETDIDISKKESESDFEEARRCIETFKLLKQAKADGMRAEVGIDQDVADKDHARDIERTKTNLDKGGADAASIVAEGREYSRMTSSQIEAIAKARESEARAKEDKVGFMMEVEDRERGDAYRRQELDAKLMNVAKPVASGASVKKCLHCGATVPIQASFCGECGTKIETDYIIDQVHFTVTAPMTMVPGNSYVIDVWAHLSEQRKEVISRAREAQGQDDIRIRSKGGVPVSRGTFIDVHLELPDFVMKDPEDILLWEGNIGNATFSVFTPAEASFGQHSGTFTFRVHGIQIAKLYFVLNVGSKESSIEPLLTQEQRVHSAFCSYASEDRNEVLGRIQGILKALPHLDIFLDVASIRSGDTWKRRIKKEIEGRDIFYLFWSRHAAKSHYVEKEWRCALDIKGIEFIDPVPLDSPEVVPPPKELAELHFNDWMLSYMQGNKYKNTNETI